MKPPTKDEARTKAVQLMRLACSTHSSEEARTAALSAVQMIQKYGLSVENASRKGQSRLPFARRKREPQTRGWITVRYPSHCTSCMNSLDEEDYAFWERGVGLTCEVCLGERGHY